MHLQAWKLSLCFPCFFQYGFLQQRNITNIGSALRFSYSPRKRVHCWLNLGEVKLLVCT